MPVLRSLHLDFPRKILAEWIHFLCIRKYHNSLFHYVIMLKYIYAWQPNFIEKDLHSYLISRSRHTHASSVWYIDGRHEERQSQWASREPEKWRKFFMNSTSIVTYVWHFKRWVTQSCIILVITSVGYLNMDIEVWNSDPKLETTFCCAIMTASSVNLDIVRVHLVLGS